MIFAHVLQPSFAHSASTVVKHRTVGTNYVVKSLDVFTRSCYVVVGRAFDKVEVAIILKPSNFLKMHTWGGESHPT